jgi:hypothetical protein
MIPQTINQERRMMTDEPTLWCAHIKGPDDIVPTQTYGQAVILSKYINKMEDVFNQDKPVEQHVWFHADPEPWPGDAADHEESLNRRREGKTDYPLLDCEKDA